MASVRDWPGWVQFTLTAAFGVCAAIVTMSIAFGDVRRDAADAKDKAASIEIRMRAVEETLPWLKAALRTGRDPDTGQPFPWVK